MSLPKYELIEHPNGFHNDHWCIKIHDGEYEGLVYQYDKVKMEEDKDGDGAMITFNTITVENPNDVDLTEENEKSIMGVILTDIITQQMKEHNENGTSDTEKPAN